jgi:hypothetical protein
LGLNCFTSFITISDQLLQAATFVDYDLHA